MVSVIYWCFLSQVLLVIVGGLCHSGWSLSKCVVSVAGLISRDVSAKETSERSSRPDHESDSPTGGFHLSDAMDFCKHGIEVSVADSHVVLK